MAQHLSLLIIFTSECEEVGTNYEGNDLMFGLMNRNGVKSSAGCSKYCSSVDNCNFWTYQYKTLLCQIKSEDSGRKRAEGFVSGSKDCPERGKWLSCEIIQCHLDEFRNPH